MRLLLPVWAVLALLRPGAGALEVAVRAHRAGAGAQAHATDATSAKTHATAAAEHKTQATDAISHALGQRKNANLLQVRVLGGANWPLNNLLQPLSDSV